MKAKIKCFLNLMGFFIIFQAQAAATPQANQTGIDSNVNISVNLVGADERDTLVVWAFHHLLSKHSMANYDEYAAGRDVNKQFVFSFPLNEPIQYILLGLKKADQKRGTYPIDAVLMPYYFVERGDKVNIVINPADLKAISLDYHQLNFSFSGLGSGKYEARFKMDSVFYNKYDGRSGLQLNGVYKDTKVQQDIFSTGLLELNKRKRSISEPAFELLETDFLYNIKNTECQALISGIQKYDQVQKKNFMSTIKAFQFFGQNLPLSQSLSISPEYTLYLLNKCKLDMMVIYNKVDFDSLYYKIKSQYDGELLDRVICLYFNTYGYRIAAYKKLITDALIQLKTPEYYSVLSGYKTRITGTMAFDFDLPDSLGNRIHLSDFAGKVVIMDFWFTGCSGCSLFYRNHLSKVEKAFQVNKNVIFISICIDSGKDYWLKSINSGNYTSKSIINLYTDGMGVKNPIIDNYKILTYPQPVILDKQHKLVQFGNIEVSTSTNMINQIEKLL